MYTIIDFMRDFRVWANYQDIDNLLNLWGPGYRAFLDQSLSTLLVFVGAFAELALASVSGPQIYAAELSRFYHTLPITTMTYVASSLAQLSTNAYRCFQPPGAVSSFMTLATDPDINSVRVSAER